jgi:hypothetical protein
MQLSEVLFGLRITRPLAEPLRTGTTSRRARISNPSSQSFRPHRETIVDEALTARADLIVMGTHGRRGFKRFLLGSVTETVLTRATGNGACRRTKCPASAAESTPSSSLAGTSAFSR